jgi:hypothetical protein
MSSPFLFIFIYYYYYYLFIYFIGNIVLGLDHLLGGRQVLPSNSAIDKCLPLYFQQPLKVQATGSET